MLNDDLKRMVTDSCANYDSGGKCLLATNSTGCRDCPFFRGGEGSIARCPYFERSVLPADDKLETRYWNALGMVEWNANLAVCKRCENPYDRKHNRIQYCDACSEEIKREKRRERNRRYLRNKQA